MEPGGTFRFKSFNLLSTSSVSYAAFTYRLDSSSATMEVRLKHQPQRVPRLFFQISAAIRAYVALRDIKS